ncbi:MAG: glutaredoxin family protein [Gammaproteobacteria bacterium]|nr:glutaredoxin family protein [Gammaproteobacteria bacterium]
MKMISVALVGIALAVGLACGPAQATKLYKWVDKDGKVSYQDTPPPTNAGKVEEQFVKGGDAAGSDAISEIAQKYPVVIYTIPKCSSCDLARGYLQKRQVPFTEKNVAQGNLANQKELQDRFGELAVPTILVGTKAMKGGYVESLLEGELDAAGYPNPGKPATPAAEAPTQSQY